MRASRALKSSGTFDDILGLDLKEERLTRSLKVAPGEDDVVRFVVWWGEQMESLGGASSEREVEQNRDGALGESKTEPDPGLLRGGTAGDSLCACAKLASSPRAVLLASCAATRCVARGTRGTCLGDRRSPSGERVFLEAGVRALVMALCFGRFLSIRRGTGSIYKIIAGGGAVTFFEFPEIQCFLKVPTI